MITFSLRDTWAGQMVGVTEEGSVFWKCAVIEFDMQKHNRTVISSCISALYHIVEVEQTERGWKALNTRDVAEDK